ncbi:MAG: pimB 3 [Labilithrix sp.]|nr:pimB 3 [Labilithrix sp.]
MSGSSILFLIDELEVGGSQRQILLLAKAFVRAGHAVTVGYFRAAGAALVPDLEAAGVAVKLIPKRSGVDPVFVARLTRFLAADRSRRVLSFGYTANLWSRLAGVLSRSPRQVSCIRNFGYLPRSTGKVSVVLGAVERVLARQSRFVVANSRLTAESMVARRLIPSSKLRVIGNAVETAPVAPRAEARARLNALVSGNDATPVVGTLARLVEPKDLPTLLRAAHSVVATRADARFVVGGEGPLRGRLESLRRELALDDRFFFPGTLAGRDVIAGLDVAVLSSSSEGMPNFVLEAMAAEVPIVSTRVGAAPDILEEGELGRLVAIGDHRGLANAIVATLDELPRARLVAARAAERVRAMTAAKIAETYLALFDDAQGV